MGIAHTDLFQALKTQASLAQAFGTLPGSDEEPHPLTEGEHIEAWHNGRLYHRGTVVKTISGTGLFWLQDDGGNRRLLDVESLDIIREGCLPHLRRLRNLPPSQRLRRFRCIRSSTMAPKPSPDGPQRNPRNRVVPGFLRGWALWGSNPRPTD